MPNKAYLEITDVCNLNCEFCHGTRRPPRFMSVAEFGVAARNLRPFADYLYFHLMGEPLLHPQLAELFEIAADMGYRVILTTNGTLLKERKTVLLSAPSLHKVSISLHSFAANDMAGTFDGYLQDCLSFAAEAAEKGIIAVLRLWDTGGNDIAALSARICDYYGCSAVEVRSGLKLRDRLYIEYGERFAWPDISLPVCNTGHRCYGLRDQVGVLCDGTVVPCCLDAEGDIPLGNIFESDITDILSRDKALTLKAQLSGGCVSEPLCMRCGYTQSRFPKQR